MCFITYTIGANFVLKLSWEHRTHTNYEIGIAVLARLWVYIDITILASY